ncbi:MAG: ABC transporter ATP-binding protein [Candidatus Omnitrophica bacterium]|nr:ABC transporter ATP-binding protein [Candidatus Omnitrophota bacterium]
MLEAKDIWKCYDAPKGKLEVLRGLDFSFERGKIIFVLGRSGAGKSTLLHILGSLDKPSRGTITVDGVDVSRLGERELAYFRNRKIGFLFQFYHLLPEFTLFENVFMPAMMAGRIEQRARAHFLLKVMGLEKRAGHYPSELSGGEQQRSALARALVNEPEIVFCDEPTGNLDEETADDVFKLILDLNKKTGQTFCIVTHEESLVEGRDEVYVLHEGKLRRRK